jgi:hypothetical protein
VSVSASPGHESEDSALCVHGSSAAAAGWSTVGSMTDRLPAIVLEYARESELSVDVAREHFELYYDSDENLVRAAIENDRRRSRQYKLLRDLTPAVAYDNEVLRALRDLGSPALVGDLARVLTDRWPANVDGPYRPGEYLTRQMWSGQRLARACQRLKDERLVNAEPVQVGAGPTQIALAYSLTENGADRARHLEATGPRPPEWR